MDLLLAPRGLDDGDLTPYGSYKGFRKQTALLCLSRPGRDKARILKRRGGGLSCFKQKGALKDLNRFWCASSCFQSLSHKVTCCHLFFWKTGSGGLLPLFFNALLLNKQKNYCKPWTRSDLLPTCSVTAKTGYNMTYRSWQRQICFMIASWSAWAEAEII